MAQRTAFVAPPPGDHLPGISKRAFAMLEGLGVTPDMLGLKTWDELLAKNLTPVQLRETLGNLIVFKKSGNPRYKEQAQTSMAAEGIPETRTVESTEPQNNVGGDEQTRVRRPRREEGRKAERRGLIDEFPDEPDVITTTTSQTGHGELDDSEINNRPGKPIDPREERPVITDPVVPDEPVIPTPLPGQEIVDAALQDPATRAAYDEGQLRLFAQNLGAPDTYMSGQGGQVSAQGFTPAFAFEGGIYSSNGQITLRYDQATQTWSWLPGIDDRAKWERIKAQGNAIFQQQNAPPDNSAMTPMAGGGRPFAYDNWQFSVTPRGNVYRWDPQSGSWQPYTGENAAQIAARGAALATEEARKGIQPNSSWTPVGVEQGINGLFWDGEQFVDNSGRPYEIPDYMWTRLEALGWTRHTMGRGGYLPPAQYHAPIDTGIGGLFWDGRRFTFAREGGGEPISVHGSTLQRYYEQLREAGWKFYGSQGWRPPAGWNADTGTDTGGGGGGQGAQASSSQQGNQTAQAASYNPGNTVIPGTPGTGLPGANTLIRPPAGQPGLRL